MRNADASLAEAGGRELDVRRERVEIWRLYAVLFRIGEDFDCTSQQCGRVRLIAEFRSLIIWSESKVEWNFSDGHGVTNGVSFFFYRGADFLHLLRSRREFLPDADLSQGPEWIGRVSRSVESLQVRRLSKLDHCLFFFRRIPRGRVGE